VERLIKLIICLIVGWFVIEDIVYNHKLKEKGKFNAFFYSPYRYIKYKGGEA